MATDWEATAGKTVRTRPRGQGRDRSSETNDAATHGRETLKDTSTARGAHRLAGVPTRRSEADRACPGTQAPCNLKPLKRKSRTAPTAVATALSARPARHLRVLRCRSPRSTDFGRTGRGGRLGPVDSGRQGATSPRGRGFAAAFGVRRTGGTQGRMVRLRPVPALTASPAAWKRTSVRAWVGGIRPATCSRT